MKPKCPRCGHQMILLNKKEIALRDIPDPYPAVIRPLLFRYCCRPCHYSKVTPIPERYKLRRITKRLAKWLHEYPGTHFEAASRTGLHYNTVRSVRREYARDIDKKA